MNTGPLQATEPWLSRRAVLGILSIVLFVSISTRILGALGDLWLDEIWSLAFALRADGPWEILTGTNHDNNHWLNTLYLWLVGDASSLYAYRFLAVFTGIGTVLLVTLHGLRRSGMAAITTATLIGCSYILIHVQSEARGYGPAIFFGLGAFLALHGFLQSRRWTLGLLYAVSATLAVLSQLTFAWVLVGMVAWSWAAYRQHRVAASGNLRVLRNTQLIPHLPPTLILLGLFWLDVRHWTIGGSPPNPPEAALQSLGQLTLGVPGPGWAIGLASLTAILICLRELWLMGRAGDPSVFFFSISVFVGPILFVVLMDLPFLYPRYLVVSIPFLLLLLGRALNRLGDSSHFGRWAWAGLLLTFLLGNMAQTAGLLSEGRGQYSAAVNHIIESSAEKSIFVAGIGETPQSSLLTFYADRLPGGDRIRIIPPDEIGPDLQWIVVQELQANGPAPEETLSLDERTFALVGSYGHRGPSGWTWHLYRQREF